MEIKKIKVSELILAEYNPRKMPPKELKKLKASIERFGYVDPIIWNKRTKRVVGGNQRLRVLKELGVPEVEVVVVDLDEKEEKQLNLALNRISGEWDEQALKAMLESLETDWEPTGFDIEEIEEIIGKELELPEEIDEFELQESDQEPRKKITCPKCGFTFFLE
jgi:ParB-like chromosome segregation protein Spo0J